MNINNIIKRYEESPQDPDVIKTHVQIVVTLQDGCGCVLREYQINPYEAISVIEQYLLEKEQKEVEKLQGRGVNSN